MSRNTNTSLCTTIIININQNIYIDISTAISTGKKYSPISGKYQISRARVHVYERVCVVCIASRTGLTLKRERGGGR